MYEVSYRDDEFNKEYGMLREIAEIVVGKLRLETRLYNEM